MVNKKTILIAEDVEKISALLARAFERINFDVITSYDGEEALRKTIEFNPDIVILDILMPKKSGLEVLRDIKADPKLKNIPVIILSCRDALHQVREGLEAGATDYITKPVFTEDLVKKVLEVL